MDVEIPSGGITTQKLCQRYASKGEDYILQTIAKKIQQKEAYLQGDTLYPGRRKPGRPPKAQKRVPITIRLPADMVDWLRTQRNYTLFIEKLLRMAYNRYREKALEKERNVYAIK